jgi:hypothetical protein
VRGRWRDTLVARFVTGLACVCLFLSFQLQSFVFMAAALFPIVQMFVVLCFVALLNATEPGQARRSPWLVAAAIAAGGAMLTTTNGLVAPVVGALLIWRRDGGRALVAALAVAGALGVAAYLVLVGPPWEHPPAAVGAHSPVPSAAAIGAYFLTFFASGVAYLNGPVAILLGGLLFGAGGYAVLRVALDRGRPARIELFGAALMLFAIASVAMAAPGRAHFGALQAAQSRYATFAMTYWTGLLFWGASRIGQDAARRYLRPPVLVGTIVVTLVVFASHVFIAVVWKAKADNIAAAALALESGVFDDRWVAALHPTTAVVYSVVRQLEAAGDRRFPSPQIGRRFEVPGSLNACAGALSIAPAGRPGQWRVDGELTTAVSAGVILDRAGVVRGLARVAPLVGSPDPPDRELVQTVWQSLARAPSGPPRWLGFAAGGDGPPYVMYPIAEGGRPVCRTELSTVAPIRAWLDAPQGVVSEVARGAGWAFQCGGTIDRLELLIDDRPHTLTALQGATARPDVPPAFAELCAVNESSGFAFQFDTRTLSTGTHTVKVRASGRDGNGADSNTQTIEVPR